MGYIGHSPTNAGTFYILDALTMGSGTTYTMQVGGVDVSPSADNLLITLDGVIQHAGDAYTVSGSNIVFASGPGSGVEFYGIIMGQSATVGQGSIGADELKVSGDGTNGQVLVSDGDGTFSWATDTENYLPLAGGTMSGAINLGSQNITNGGTITGTFVGNITGNVTGNTSGTAATVTGAAQTNITSVGTLTGLSSSDHVVLNNNKYFKVKDTAGSDIRVIGLANSNDVYVGFIDDATGTGNLYLRTSATNALTIDSSQNATFAGSAFITGDATVGTTSLLEGTYTQFEVKQASDATGIALTSANSNSDARNWGLFTNYSAWGSLDFRYSAAKDNTPRTNLGLALTKDGNVLIGTTDNDAKLMVKKVDGTSYNQFVIIEGDTTDNNNYSGISFKAGTLANAYPEIGVSNGGLMFQMSGGYHSSNYNNRTKIEMNGSDGHIRFMTGGDPAAEKMRIDSSGNVKILTGSLQLNDVAQSIDFIQSGAINFDSNGDQTGRVLTIGSNRAAGSSGGTTNVVFNEDGSTNFHDDVSFNRRIVQNGLNVYVKDTDVASSSGSTFTILRSWHDTANWGQGMYLVEVFQYYPYASAQDYASWNCTYGYSGGTTVVEQIANTGSINAPAWTGETTISGNLKSRNLEISIAAYHYVKIRVTTPDTYTDNADNNNNNTVHIYP